jgi:hypothetical protein
MESLANPLITQYEAIAHFTSGEMGYPAITS